MNPLSSKDIIFNDLMVDWTEDIVLVEGAFDAIKAGDNAIPILGSTLEVNSSLFNKILNFESKVFVALDKDARWKQLKLIKSFMAHEIEVYSVDTAPFDDVGKMSHKEFLERKEEAVLVDENMLLRLKLENV